MIDYNVCTDESYTEHRTRERQETPSLGEGRRLSELPLHLDNVEFAFMQTHNGERRRCISCDRRNSCGKVEMPWTFRLACVGNIDNIHESLRRWI